MVESTEMHAAREIERLIQQDSVEDVNTPAFEILRQVAAPLAVLDELAQSKEVDARMWVVFTLDDGVVAGGEDILGRLARDRDPDVRTEAISALVKVNPERARRLVPDLVKRLASTDYYEPISAMWALAELRATEAAPDVRAAADRWAPSDWHNKEATVILAYLEGRTEQILERIRSHDHVAMPWLTRAAALASTPGATDTLRWAERNEELDEECRNHAREELIRLRVVDS